MHADATARSNDDVAIVRIRSLDAKSPRGQTVYHGRARLVGGMMSGASLSRLNSNNDPMKSFKHEEAPRTAFQLLLDLRRAAGFIRWGEERHQSGSCADPNARADTYSDRKS